MKLVQKTNSLIDLVVGKRTYNEKVGYRKLYYLICKEVNDGMLVLNNLTKAIILLEKEEINAFKNLDFIGFEDLRVRLVELLFLVEQDFNEKQTADSLRNISKTFSASKEITNFTILPTTSCNARCFYCFEADAKYITMDEKTAKAVAEYIIKKSAGKSVNIHWFGGEPTCNIAAIDTICDILVEKKINYKSSMTTNGYLFDSEVIKKSVKKWNLKGLQITLDGLADTYNRVKNYKNGDNNAFSRVIDNIDKLSKAGVSVRIRLNMDKHNSDELYELTDFLSANLAEKERLSLYVMPLYENVGFEKTVHNEVEREELMDSCIALTDYFSKSGFAPRKYYDINTIRNYACQADNPDMQLILPDGKLAFCEHYLENDSFGSVYDENLKKPFWCDYRKPINECNTCPLYPTCLVLERCEKGNGNCDRYTIYSHTKSLENSLIKTYEYLKKQG